MTIIELICSPEPALDIETGNKSNPYPATRKQLARPLPKFRYTTNTETLSHELFCYLKPKYVIPSRATVTKHMQKSN